MSEAVSEEQELPPGSIRAFHLGEVGDHVRRPTRHITATILEKPGWVLPPTVPLKLSDDHQQLPAMGQGQLTSRPADSRIWSFIGAQGCFLISFGCGLYVYLSVPS